MLDMISTQMPRDAGNGWKLPKFHNLTHTVREMRATGNPKVRMCEVGEKNHKPFAKRIGRRCHKNKATFAKECSLRLSDAFIIHSLAREIGIIQDVFDDSL